MVEKGNRAKYCKICRTYYPKDILKRHNHSSEEIEAYIKEYRESKKPRAQLAWLAQYLEE